MGDAELDTHRPHVFDLAAAPAKDYDGGQIRQANGETFPIMSGQDVSVSPRTTSGWSRR